MKPAYARTDYAELYRDTYWGDCRSAEQVPGAIIANRNAFARTWRLRKPSNARIPPFSICGADYDFDHPEIYRDNDGGCVVLCSNYGRALPPAAMGMREVAPLYVVGARSFAVRFRGLREMRAAFRAAFGGR